MLCNWKLIVKVYMALCDIKLLDCLYVICILTE
jgi:hypothetical protein